MPDYSKGVIYVIRSINIEVNKVYIGSTCNFRKRIWGHKSYYNNEKNKAYNYKIYNYIRENGGWDNFEKIVLEEYPCINRYELEKRETEVIREYGENVLNVNFPTGNREMTKEELILKQKEYREANKEAMILKQKKYYEANKEELRLKKKEYRETNKEKISLKQKEYRETNKEERRLKDKERYEANKEELILKSKEYYEANKEEIRLKSNAKREVNKEERILKKNEKREANKEKRKLKKNEKRECSICGGIYTVKNRATHNRTQKHISFLENADILLK